MISTPQEEARASETRQSPASSDERLIETKPPKRDIILYRTGMTPSYLAGYVQPSLPARQKGIRLTYLTEPAPPRYVPLPVLLGVWRIVAPNPGPMTYHGTNTYLIDSPDGLIVLDPGPADDAHLDAIVRAAGSRATAILLSHGHRDHCEGAPELAVRLGIPVLGYRGFKSQFAKITRGLEAGDRIAGMICLHTPGHAPDHLCFARPDGITFSGDQVMAWSSSVVPYPSGDMEAFIASLEALRDRGDRLLLPGHGPALPVPAAFIDDLIERRLAREREILDLLGVEALTAEEIVQSLYAKRGPSLVTAATHNVRAHLAKLTAEGQVTSGADGRWGRMAETAAALSDEGR